MKNTEKDESFACYDIEQGQKRSLGSSSKGFHEINRAEVLNRMSMSISIDVPKRTEVLSVNDIEFTPQP